MSRYKKDILYNRLRNDILTGVYPVGTKLPRELDFAEECGVSFITLRSALKQLEEDGLISRQPSKGTFVRRRHPEASAGRRILIYTEYTEITFFQELLAGAAGAALNEQVELERLHYSDFCRGKLPAEFLAGEFHGIIWDRPEKEHTPEILALQRLHVPQVTINRNIESVASLSGDYLGVIDETVQFFRRIGHHRIAMFDFNFPIPIFQNRQQRFLKLLQQDNIDDPAAYLQTPSSNDRRYWEESPSIQETLRNCTAILVMNVDQLGNVLSLLEARQRRIPDDVSLIYVGAEKSLTRNTDDFSVFTESRREVGEAAVHDICRQITGEADAPGHRVLPGKLVMRRSCAIPKHLRSGN